MGFPTSLVTVVSSTLDLTYPHRHIAYFQIFHGRGLGLPVPWLGEKHVWGGMVSDPSGTGDPVSQGRAVSILH